MNVQVANFARAKVAPAATLDCARERTAVTTIVPVIMCGGSGTRLWPASRDSMPKQFIRLLDQRSTFQMTAERFGDPVFAKPIVVASTEVRFIVAEQLLAVGVEADVVLEPCRRDSAAAVAVASCLATQRNPDAIVLVVAADHLIDDAGAFVAACIEAAEAAHKGYIMTLGVRPSKPAMGYGYIRAGEPISDTKAAKIERFVEKPDAVTAARYIADGYLWNSGNFLFRADVMTSELRAHVPDVLEAAQAAIRTAQTDLGFSCLGTEAFASAPKVSIDYAVMERTDKAGVLPVSFRWSDIGTWDGIWEVSSRDARGNAVRGHAELLGTSNSLVQSDELLTTVVGLENVVVVTTPDAVLVASRDHSDKIKTLVEQLQVKQRPETKEHLRVYRPWGWYQRIDDGTRFQVKRIMVKPGHRLSLQKHFHRAEHWVVVRGIAEVTVDDVVSLRHENEAAYLPIGSVHRLANPGKIPLELIEVQVGSYTGEDDILRFEDAYGR